MNDRKKMILMAILALICAGFLAYPDIAAAIDWLGVARGKLECPQAVFAEVCQTLSTIGSKLLHVYFS